MVPWSTIFSTPAPHQNQEKFDRQYTESSTHNH
jgi:hypothetical protein